MHDLFSEDGFYRFLADFGYWGILFFFATIDQLTPVPEEITLMGIGYLCMNGALNPFLAAFFAFVGLLTVDIVYFWLARSGNKLLSKFTGYQQDSFIDRYAEKLKTHFGKTLLVLCFVPRMRIVGPVAVGMLRMNFGKFILFDAIALMIFTLLYITLGMLLHDELGFLFSGQGWVRHIVFASGMVVGILLFLVLFRKRKKTDGQRNELR